MLGEEVEIDGPPTFSARVETPRPLRIVQIARSGELIHTLTPGSNISRFDFVDPELPPGQAAWYYIRCEQDNDQYGWSSPVWVKRKG